MDSDACFDAMQCAMTDCRWQEAEGHAEDLMEWIVKGGFPPHGLSRTKTLRLILGNKARAEIMLGRLRLRCAEERP